MKKAVSLLIQNPKVEYLLIQRSSACKNFVGCWEFPGGKVDGDEPPHNALLREVAEEIGLALPVPAGDPMRRILVPDGSVEYSFFKWSCPHESLDVNLSHEHQAYRWTSFTETRKLPLVQVHQEFLEWQWLDNQIRVYETQELPHYEQYAKTLNAVLNQLRERWSPLAIVQVRAKSLSSFADKCLRKADKYNDPAHELTDLCGGRIVTTTTHEAEAICRQIRKLFHPVDEDDDTRKRHGISAFGYLSVHFLVHFREGMTEMLEVAIPPEITGLKAEIQVRTLLQHAHSEVTHDRLYKAGYIPPQYCEREAARVAAGLESVDEEFARFVQQLDVYVGHYAAHLSPAKRRRELANLKLVLEHEKSSAKQVAIALRMAKLCRAAWDWKGIVEALEPFANVACLAQPWLQMELGNALCRLHLYTPHGPDFQRGLQLMESVARPDADTCDCLESDERDCCATALGWLGSALSKLSGRRAEARACLAKAVELAPGDPYHLVAFVELDLAASSTDDHLALLAPMLRQASGRCLEHIQAGIEVTRAWLTLSKARLLLDDETGAVEALCLAGRSAENHYPIADFQRSLERLTDAIGGRKPFVSVLDQVALLLAKAKEFKHEQDRAALDWRPFVRRFDFKRDNRVLILAGNTTAGAEAQLAAWEQPLQNALLGFQGYILTGGTAAGVCGLAARLTERLNAAKSAQIELVGYVPAKIEANCAFKNIVHTPKTEAFSLREPIQMWTDLLLSGVDSTRVTLLCLGGGQISAQELALAWALGARAAVLNDDSLAARRFSEALSSAGNDLARGMVLPADPATLRAFIPFDQSVDASRWEKAGAAVHQVYLDSQHKSATQSNLLPWSLLRDDFKHSNRHQAACSADILRQAGYEVIETNLPADQIPPPNFEDEEVKRMAELEHGRWNVERLNSGWRFGEKKDEERRLSPYLVPWEKVPDKIKAYDFDAVRAWPKILASAGFVVKRRAV